MNKTSMKNLNILRIIGQKIVRHVWYWNFLLLALILIWVYFFSRNYFLRSKENIKFIKDNIVDITYTQLEIEKFNKIWQPYKDKLNFKADVPEDLMSPF